MSGGGRSDFASSVQRSTRSDSSPLFVRTGTPSTPIRSPRSRATRRSKGSLAEDVLAGVQLKLAAAVLEVEERRLAVPAPCRQPAGQAKRVIRLLARSEPLVALEHLRHGDAVRERDRIGIDASGAQPLELAPPLGEQVRLAAAGRL